MPRLRFLLQCICPVTNSSTSSARRLFPIRLCTPTSDTIGVIHYVLGPDWSSRGEPDGTTVTGSRRPRTFRASRRSMRTMLRRLDKETRRYHASCEYSMNPRSTITTSLFTMFNCSDYVYACNINERPDFCVCSLEPIAIG